MCIYLAVVLSHNTLFCTYLLTHQFCGPFGLFALDPFVACLAPFCIPDGWPLPSDNLTPVGDGKTGARADRAFILHPLCPVKHCWQWPYTPSPHGSPTSWVPASWVPATTPPPFVLSGSGWEQLSAVTILGRAFNSMPRQDKNGGGGAERRVQRYIERLRKGWRVISTLALCAEYVMLDSVCTGYSAEMPSTAGKQPVPLIQSLFVWNMMPLILTSSSTEGEKNPFCALFWQGSNRTSFTRTYIYFSDLFFNSPLHIRILSPKSVRSPVGLMFHPEPLVLAQILLKMYFLWALAAPPEVWLYQKAFRSERHCWRTALPSGIKNLSPATCKLSIYLLYFWTKRFLVSFLPEWRSQKCCLLLYFPIPVVFSCPGSMGHFSAPVAMLGKIASDFGYFIGR